MRKIYADQKGPKDEWAKLKNEPLKVKLEWLVQYYGLIALGVLIAVIMLVSITVTVIVNSMPRVVIGEFFSEAADVSYNERLKEELCDILEYDAKKYQIDISSTMGTYASNEVSYQIQRLSARVNAKDLDFVVANAKLFIDFTDTSDAQDCMFKNLNDFLPADTLKALEEAGRLMYIETDAGSVPYYIDINDTRFYRLYKLYSGEAYFGVIFNAPDTPGVIALIENYILEK